MDGPQDSGPSRPGDWQLLSGGRAPIPTSLGRMGCTAPVHRKRACGLPAQWPPISQPVSAPMSSLDWGFNNMHLVKVKPKNYLIYSIINHYEGVTSMVNYLIGTCGPYRNGAWCPPGTWGRGLVPSQQEREVRGQTPTEAPTTDHPPTLLARPQPQAPRTCTHSLPVALSPGQSCDHDTTSKLFWAPGEGTVTSSHLLPHQHISHQDTDAPVSQRAKHPESPHGT